MRAYFAVFLCVFLLLFNGCSAPVKTEQYTAVVINEVVTCGSEYDWIELHNTANVPVSLAGCFLSDDEQKPGKWQFPAITLQSDEYLVLYAKHDDAGALSFPFGLSASGTTLVFSQHNGNVIQKLTVPASAPALSYGLYHEDYTWFASPTCGKDNITGMVLGQDLIMESEGLRINEYMTDNRSVLYDADGSYSDWIEIYNFSDKHIDLSGYTLTDARNDVVKWRIPNNTFINAHDYLVVRCSARDTLTPTGEIHTNFKLGNQDSFLGLYTKDGRFCSGITVHPLERDYSCGYIEGVGYTVLRYPTPAFANNSAIVEEVEP